MLNKSEGHCFAVLFLHTETVRCLQYGWGSWTRKAADAGLPGVEDWRDPAGSDPAEAGPQRTPGPLASVSTHTHTHWYMRPLSYLQLKWWPRVSYYKEI